MKEKIKNLLDVLLLEQLQIEASIRDSQNKGRFFKAVHFFEEWKTITIKINTLKDLL